MNTIGPFKEGIFFKEKGIKSLLKKKNYYFFVDSFFQVHTDFINCNDNVFFIDAGEQLKTLESFKTHISWLQSIGADKNSTLVSVGGGSVGDSIGFLASVYLRGIDLIHVPTTWLSAIDSSIGGKTAVNFQTYKNQIGTVYAPKSIFFFKNLIESSNIKDSEGEILKTLILNLNTKWSKKILRSETDQLINFSDIPDFVRYKTKIVKKDPLDTKGLRAVLNLGHSLGHAIEMKCKVSHSEAVKKGLKFAICWSYQKKTLSKKYYEWILTLLDCELPQMKSSDLKIFLEKDKKSYKNRINFIFICDEGPVIKSVTIKSVVKEYERQLKVTF